MNPRADLGFQGEERVAQFLSAKGLKIVEKRYRTKVGEVDLIAKDGEDWVFIEVKTREVAHKISALDAITPAKQLRIVKAALHFMKANHHTNAPMRFDVVTLEANQLDWIRSAFEPDPRYTF